MLIMIWIRTRPKNPKTLPYGASYSAATRTQLINAIRGHLTEYGWIAPKGPSHLAMLADLLEKEEMARSLPEAARAMLRLMLDLLAGLDGKVADQASKRGAPKGSWLEQMLARKPRMLVTVALANKMARIIWALLVKQENYRAPVAAKA
jgi:transposase